jgi:hypothetical protein
MLSIVSCISVVFPDFCFIQYIFVCFLLFTLLLLLSGIGSGKMHLLPTEMGPGSMQLMGLIKRSIDPANIMNPGKVLIMEDDNGKEARLATTHSATTHTTTGITAGTGGTNPAANTTTTGITTAASAMTESHSAGTQTQTQVEGATSCCGCGTNKTDDSTSGKATSTDGSIAGSTGIGTTSSSCSSSQSCNGSKKCNCGTSCTCGSK